MKKSIVGNSFIYLFASLINKAIPFILLPLITKYLSPNEYGILSICLLIGNIYLALAGMNMYANISKNFFKVTKKELGVIIENIIVILTFNTAAVMVLTFVIIFYTDSFFSIPSLALLILPVLNFFSMLNALNLTVLRNEGKALSFGCLEILYTILTLTVTIFLLVMLDIGWLSQIIGSLFAFTILSIYSITSLVKREYIRSYKPNKKAILSILTLSLPLIPHFLAGIVISVSDRLFIEEMVGVGEVGIYAIGCSFGMIAAIFIDSFIKAWSPWFYKTMAKPTLRKKTKVVKFTYLFIIASGLVALSVNLVTHFLIPLMVAEAYFGAQQYVPWVALGCVVHGVYKIFFPYVVHLGKTKILAQTTLCAAIINLIFNYYFIDAYGTVGAAYATIVAYFVSAVLVASYCARKEPMPWFYFLHKKAVH